jgi:hypothetical protein
VKPNTHLGCEVRLVDRCEERDPFAGDMTLQPANRLRGIVDTSNLEHMVPDGPPPTLAVTAAVEPTAMEGRAVEGTMMNVVTAKKAEPKREP